MSYCDYLAFVVRPSSSVRRPSTPLNDFSSETPGQIFFKVHVETSVKGGLSRTNGDTVR